MISVYFQGKPVSFTVIQVCAPTTNAEEAERLYEDLQDLELTLKSPFHHRGLECKSRNLREPDVHRQVWPWPTKWSRAKAKSKRRKRRQNDIDGITDSECKSEQAPGDSEGQGSLACCRGRWNSFCRWGRGWQADICATSELWLWLDVVATFPS